LRKIDARCHLGTGLAAGLPIVESLVGVETREIFEKRVTFTTIVLCGHLHEMHEPFHQCTTRGIVGILEICATLGIYGILEILGTAGILGTHGIDRIIVDHLLRMVEGECTQLPLPTRQMEAPIGEMSRHIRKQPPTEMGISTLASLSTSHLRTRLSPT
jgi:hypothetical protein